MPNKDKISQLLRYLSDISDWRFAIGVRIRFANPTLTYQTYPKAWIEYYDANHLLYQDPTIRWGMTHTGTATWAELADQDAAGVFDKAAAFGLRHGLIVSVGEV
ncbi:transcriptional regulator, partial [Thioclava sp. BHET1]